MKKSLILLITLSVLAAASLAGSAQENRKWENNFNKEFTKLSSYQDNLNQFREYNLRTIESKLKNRAFIQQQGIANKALINQKFKFNKAFINQIGNLNSALIKQSSNNDTAIINQSGTNNKAVIIQK